MTKFHATTEMVKNCTELYRMLNNALLLFTETDADKAAIEVFRKDYDSLCVAVLSDDPDEAHRSLLLVAASFYDLTERLVARSVEILGGITS